MNKIQIGNIKIEQTTNNSYWVTNDDEGMIFHKEELEKLLKEILYKNY